MPALSFRPWAGTPCGLESMGRCPPADPGVLLGHRGLRGQFDDHHTFILRILLDTIDHLSVQVDRLTAQTTTKFAQMAEASGPEVDGAPGAGAGDTPGQSLLLPLIGIERLDEIPDVNPTTAQVILAEALREIVMTPRLSDTSSSSTAA
ncbi:hypothetical protein [Streptomyces sp. NPDC056817]|uniref:hypothetical protein n=1 Tax=Streptomyces sp. NPDC056817 TaxID=3345950 RepID=UPI0036CC6317